MAGEKGRCPSCFQLVSLDAPCPYCGEKEMKRDIGTIALPTDVVLHNNYIVGKKLGAGGFGITYKCYDRKNQRVCCIKEYVPLGYSNRLGDGITLAPSTHENKDIYDYGREKFLSEARTLEELRDVPDVVEIYDSFRENGTAYFAMEFINGVNLNRIRKEAGGHLSYEMTNWLIMKAAQCLQHIHTKGNIFHRDISPENIMLTKSNQVKIIDFGTAKYIHGKKSQNLSVVLKPGYAPLEQYTSTSRQGAFTDVYALAATYYYLLTGRRIPQAPDRMSLDNPIHIIPLEEYDFLGPDFAQLTEVLNEALALRADDRLQTMVAFARRLEDFRNIYQGSSAKKTPLESYDRETELSVQAIPSVVGLTNPIRGYRYYFPPNRIVTIGRSNECNIIVPNNVVGRKHMELFFDTTTDLFYVVDLHSRNKTRLNGRICNPEKIIPAKPGSVVSLAKDSCVFRLEVRYER